MDRRDRLTRYVADRLDQVPHSLPASLSPRERALYLHGDPFLFVSDGARGPLAKHPAVGCEPYRRLLKPPWAMTSRSRRPAPSGIR